VPVTIVRLGSTRQVNEGLRIGAVRRVPRGVPKAEWASRDFFDVWLPQLSPSPELMKLGQLAQDRQAWSDFAGKFRSEVHQSGAERILDLLVALSHTANFSLGCYCPDEDHCHRSILRRLLVERGATIRER
jgi:uncharacterized protein YeaO (DUF488 family)